MKIYAETEDGKRLEIKEIQGLGEGKILILQSQNMQRRGVLDLYENLLSAKLNRQVIVLNMDVKVIGTI